MSDELIIVTPELSPETGGVGDYTLRILEGWPDTKRVKVLTAKSAQTASRFRVENLGWDEDAILRQLGDAGRVLVQYSAYGFDPRGYPARLVRALCRWKSTTEGRLVLMFHEIWTFWPMLHQNFFVQRLHRRAIRRLLECADTVFTSTQSQADHLAELSSRRPVHVLPVGSNIRRTDDVDLVRIPRSALVFGRQETRLRALRKMRPSLTSLAQAGIIDKIASVGANDEARGKEEEQALLGELELEGGFAQHGRRAEAEVSSLLGTFSFGILGQDELSLSKSGTFMAYAAHELNVLADFADVSRPEPVCWLVAPSELLSGISESELKKRAKALHGWQSRVASWNLISRSFREALEMEHSSGSTGVVNA